MILSSDQSIKQWKKEGGVFSIKMIAMGNGIDNLSSNPRWGCLHFTSC